MNKDIVLMLHRMSGGGAERVMILLANWLAKEQNNVTLVLVDQKLCDAIKYDIDPMVKVVSLKDETKHSYMFIKKSTAFFYRLYSKVYFRLAKLLGKSISDKAVFRKYISKYADELNALYEIISDKSDVRIIAFLDNPIHFSLLMKEKFPSIKLVISERNDPKIHDGSKTATLFIKKYYALADSIVFQSNGAKSGYREDLQKKGVIIPNPLTLGLPDRHSGERRHVVVNFCRISEQKNLPLLINAFEKFHETHNDYSLEIVGDATNEEGEKVLSVINKLIDDYSLNEFVNIRPFDPKLHCDILDYAMFVSSSDYEGMSNSMLEAMAIGLPSVCTDCPAGGAREIIDDHINGILTPVNDIDALCEAMSEVADNKELSERLSENAVKLKDRLSVEKIMNEWWRVIDA